MSNRFVHLVGAGPGHPGLMTVRARELIRSADVIVHDRLIPRGVLAEARPDAEIIDVGKAPGRSPWPQEQINELLIARAREGYEVVRLKGGDPFVFGRGAEEFAACRNAGIPCSVTPGVTSATAVPALAGVPLTNRQQARSVAIVTGRAGADGTLPDHDFAALARMDTLVVLMGRSTQLSFCKALIDAGRDPHTAAVCIASGGTPRQRMVTATLATLADATNQAGLSAPVVTVIGPTAAMADVESICEAPSGPLTGRCILLTQARESSGELHRCLTEAGAQVLNLPMIRILSPADTSPIDSAIARLDEFDWLAYSSVHGVRGFWTRLTDLGKDARSLAGLRIGAIGEGTAAELRGHGIEPDLLPPKATASQLADAISREVAGDCRGLRVLCPCGNLALPTLAEKLRSAGAHVLTPEVYRNESAPKSPRAQELIRLADTVVFCSPSAARRFAAMHPDMAPATIACIGPTTAAVAREAGLAVHIIPQQPGSAGLIEALIDHLSRPGTTA